MPIQLSGSLAITGSLTTSTTIGAQGAINITNTSNPTSFTSTASLYTNGGARFTRDLYVSGTSYFNNVTIFGTQSVQYITSSQLNIGTNIISVNTDVPTIRFGGLAVYDSGSTGLTGSMLWDSEDNQWIYSNPSGSAYDSAVFLVGPRNSGTLGNEVGITTNALAKGDGAHHMTSSAIIENGTLTSMYSTMYVSSSGNVGIGTSSPARRLNVQGNDDGTLQIRMQGSAATDSYCEIGRESLSTGDFRVNVCRSGTVINALKISDITGAATFSNSVTAGGSSLFNAGTGALSADILTVRGGGGSGAFGFKIEANNGEDIFYTDNFTYNIIANPIGGNFGIGTTSPGVKLDVFGGQARVSGSTNEQLVLDYATSSGGFTWQSFRINGTNKYRLVGNVDNSFGIYNDTLSAYALTIASTSAATFANALQVAGQQAAANYGGTGLNFDFTSGNIGRIASVKTTSGGSQLQFFVYNTSGTDVNALQIASTGAATFSNNVLVNGEGNYIGIDATGGAPRLGFVKLSGAQPFLGFAADTFTIKVSSGSTIATSNTFTTTLSIATSGAATFSNEVIAGSWISVPNSRGLTIRNSANTAYRTAVYMNAGNVLIFGQDSDISALTLGVGSESMRITSGGLVGIGTTSPAFKLTVNGSASAQYWRVFGNNGLSGYLLQQGDWLGTSATNLSIAAEGGNGISFFTNGAVDVRMFINTSGNVGIGTTSPGAYILALDYNASAAAVMSIKNSSASGYSGAHLLNNSGTLMGHFGYANASTAAPLTDAVYFGSIASKAVIFTTNDTEKMRITSGGRVLIGTTSDTGVGGLGVSNTGFSGGANGLLTLIGGSESSIMFQSAGYGVDTNKIGLDNTSGAFFFRVNSSERMRITSGGEVGIGVTPTSGNRFWVRGSSTSSGDTSLFIQNSASSALFMVRNDGNVGIGTSSPTGLLEIYRSSSGGLGGHIILNNNGAAVGNETAIIFQDGGTSVVRAAISSTTEGSPFFGDIKFKTGLTTYGSLNTRMIILGNGNVGINTTSPSNALHVVGTIRWGSGGTAYSNYTDTDGGGMYIETVDNGTGRAKMRFQTRVNNSGGYTSYQIDADNNQHIWATNGSTRMTLNSSFALVPGSNGTQDLGSSSLRWSTVFTSDLDMSNGIGDYTIVEGEEDLFLYNNKTNKVFKFVIQEVDPSTAPPKKVK